jgi:Flp pilus assembly protein TadG
MSQAREGGDPRAPRKGLLTRLGIGRRRSAGTAPRRAAGFLARLRSDARGNTIAIVGAALVPLTMIIGSGVDMSRAYMAKTRLQSACDAGALAGRRVMTNDTLTTQVTTEANRFFNFNFPQGLYHVNSFTPAVTRPSPGTVRMTATTTIPTTIMAMFGFTTLPLEVSCEASLNMANTDVMLVLDVTGSMADTLNGTQKIVALRDATMALYDELAPIQTQLQAAGMRLRYGVVPYSSTVNVGALIRAANPAYLVNSWAYQSRQPEYQLTNITQAQCDDYANWSWRQNRRGSTTLGTCTYTSESGSMGGTWTGDFQHDQIIHDTSTYKTGASTPVPTRRPGATQNSTWAGCIEERETVSTITAASGFTIPPGAIDLDINRIPDSDATRWRPLWPEVIYRRDGADEQMFNEDDSNSRKVNGACPAAARRLQAWARADLLTYVNALQPTGNTYHDIGMIWGARLISSGGVFADSPDVFNNMPVARHIIFMTDGELAPSTGTYSAYGVEPLDRRVTGSASGSGQYDRHLQRFRMICNAARGQNVSIWVIAFGVTMTADMQNCASNANQASTSNNRADLIARFRQIGNQIGALRLTQ